MRKPVNITYALLGLSLVFTGCRIPAIVQSREAKPMPHAYSNSTDTTTVASIGWREFFTDKNLVNLIDTALKNNQELMITLQEIAIVKNEIQFRQIALQPKVNARLGAGVEKVGRYTSQGAGDKSTEITPGEEVPDALTDITAAVSATWEVDIWRKLRNAKEAAITRYLATKEGRNFVITNLVAELAGSYYELLALDNQLEIVRQNIALQKNAFEIVKVQKEASRATELAVQKFNAEVLKSQSLEFDILQKINETENRINLLAGRYKGDIPRDRGAFLNLVPAAVRSGMPAQLLASRPDIKQAELQLVAAKLDVKVARAEFYPSLGISAGIGMQAFKPAYLLKFPESMLYNLAADLAGPIINRNAIKAEFYNANARQLQAMYNYERIIMNAYLEVSTQLSRINNLEKSYELKAKQVSALSRSIEVSNDLFKSARADYLEVLMTQRDALEAKLELVDTKRDQLNAVISVYRNLGGGWR